MVLEKGSKFTPTPSRNHQELRKDLNAFNRKLRLREFFYPEDDEVQSDNDDNDNPDLLRNKGKFNPPHKRDKNLDSFIDFINNYPLETESRSKNVSNISKDERKAINTLANDNSIVIKQADKGGAFVIMDTDFYTDKMEEHVHDRSTYTPLLSNQDDEVMGKIKRLTDKYHNNLTEKEIDYLLNFETKTSNLYGLPKVHKSNVIKDQIDYSFTSTVKCNAPEDLKMRPIIAGPQCPTSRLSNLVDILIKPLIHQVKSYVRDDLDFLTHLPTIIDNDSSLLTFDVTSLYTNIPHESGITAVKYWLERNRSGIPDRFENNFILDAIQLILENNSFHFNGNFFNQIKGTAMGTKMAPSYATLFMGYLEVSLYQKISNELGTDIGNYFQENWLRYLDDCFIIWPKSFGDHNILIKILNSLHPNMKFTTNTNNNETPFLDIMISIQDKQLHTDIYYKPTDTQQYLHFKSCHPRHTKINIPYNLARRICTIVSDKKRRDERLEELKTMLHKREYPLNLIETGINKAKSFTRNELLKPKDKQQNESILTFVHTYNPNNKQMSTVINNSLEILQGSTRLNNILKHTNIIMSKRQAPNLKQLLTRAKTNNNTNYNPTVSKCNNKRCGTCKHLLEGNTITFQNQSKPFKVKQNMSCTSKNLIYVLNCNGCNSAQYIGQTNDLRKRVTIHRQQIKDAELRKLPVSQHIHRCAKNITPQFTIFPFYKMNNDNTQARLIKETHFIQKFKPSLNKTQKTY